MQILTDIVIDALATAIEDAYAALDPAVVMPVARGVPVQGDGDERFEFAAPSISITAGESQTENVGAAQYVREEDVDADTVRYTWRRAYVSIPLQLDFYTEDKTQRHALAATLEALFFPKDVNNVPQPEGLRLTLSNHFDAACRVVLESTAQRDDEGADQGYARAVLALEASTSLLEQTEHDKITRDVEVEDL